MDDQTTQMERIEERLNLLETKMTDEKNLITEIKSDVEQLEVVDRLNKRLETNVDKILKRLDALSDHIFNQSEQDHEHVKSEQSIDLSQVTKIEQHFHKHLESATELIVTKINEMMHMKHDVAFVKERYQELKDKQDQMISQIEKLHADVDHHLNAPLRDGYIWTIKDISTKLVQPELNEWSPAIKLRGYLFGAQAIIQSQADNLYLFFTLRETDQFRALTKIKFLPTLTVAICDIDTCTNNGDKDLIRVCDPQFGYGAYQYNTTYYRVLICKKEDIIPSKYINNNMMHVKMTLLPLDEIEKPFSTNGTLMWTINNYQKRRAMEEEGLVTCQQSPHFYTSDKGYRVKFELELRNGTAKVRVYFINGEFDRNLNSAFAHTTTLTLVDQATGWLSNNAKVVSVRKSNIQDKYYEMNLSLNVDLKNSKDSYIKNDTILIKAEIQPSTPA